MELLEIEYINTDLPKYWNPYYIYEVLVNEIMVGKVVLREGTVQERYYDGHIGYTILPCYRGHNYAYQATLLLCDIAKQKGFKELVITCSPENTASKKTIQKLPAAYIETKPVPKEFLLHFNKDETIKEIYIITL